MQYMAILTKSTVYKRAAFQIAGYHETRSTDVLHTCEVSVLQREGGLRKPSRFCFQKSPIAGSEAHVEIQFTRVDCLLGFFGLLVKTFGLTLAIQLHQEKNMYSKTQTLHFY